MSTSTASARPTGVGQKRSDSELICLPESGHSELRPSLERTDTWRRATERTFKDAALAEIRSVEEILRSWDPIGVMPGAFAPRDEYDSGCTVAALAAHLERLGVETMGIGLSSAAGQAHSLRFATQIITRLRPVSSEAEPPK